ncbi:ABC transporter ATP-binding protein [Candidatus Acetothermia bacterium]|nr:ABC transporter ATP-binding protein [Candidatus Acetothermia bacterium]
MYEMGEVPVKALRGLDLEIRAGEFVALMGPSGSGKSTLMHLFGALDQPSEGEVRFENEEISRLDENQLAELRGRKVGFIFQTFNLVPTLTALENVELPMVFQNVPRANRRSRAQTLLERVSLGERLHHQPSQLSGGEQQRVAIARALANHPEIILADEPTGNLDTESGEKILRLLKDLNAEGKTIVLVTHNPEAAAYASRIIRLKDGHRIEDLSNPKIS